LAAGYKGRELKDIIQTVDYTKFMDKDRLQSMPLVGNLIGLLMHKGLHSGNYIEQWIGDLLTAKGKTKFRDISINGDSRLKIIAADVTKKEIMILPDDLSKYAIDPMEFEIAKAVRMSASIPFYFNPVQLSYNNGNSMVVDGGILSNFPVWLFDVKGIPRWPTIGFKLLESDPGKIDPGKTDIFSYLIDIIETVIGKNEEIYLKDKDAVRTISIFTLGIKATKFDLIRQESQKLFDEGYTKAREFIKSWDFQEYIKKYRK
jgi:NTE family protein